MEYWELWEIVLFNKVMERSYGMELGLLLHLAIQYTNVEKSSPSQKYEQPIRHYLHACMLISMGLQTYPYS